MINVGKTTEETRVRAEAAIRAAMPVAERDPLRPEFHFRAPANWMNDICGALWHEGWYHIFYQFNPFADRCDWSDVTPCWGHARSRDLIHWDHLPIAVAPSINAGNYQCASGCATHRADGTPMLFYGHTPLPRPDGTRPPRQQWAALPLDPELRTWRTLDIGLAPGRSGVPTGITGCWTDMFVFREAGRTFAIFKEAGGLVVEAQNPEMTRWQAVGRIDGVFGECPNFIKLHDRWLLLRSTYPMTYQVGRFDPERIAFEMDGPAGIVDHSYGLTPPPDPADPNYYYLDASDVPVCRYGAPYPAYADSRGFYATSAFADARGRTLLLAWVGAWPSSRGWNCCMSLPRVLSLNAAGRLVQQPIPELARLRGAPVSVGPLNLNGEARRIEGFTGDTLEATAEFELATAEAVELALRDDTGATAVRIRYDGRALDANGTVLPRVLGDDPRRVKLQLFYDRSVMELFINDGLQTVTRVALPPSPALHLEVAATGGAAILRAATVWPIKPSRGTRGSALT
jgi:beta-fructofuranosidase